MVTWDIESDWSNLVDSTGVTNDGLASHTSRDTLDHGYEYGSLTKGLVAYYPMDEGEGEVLHDGALDNLGQINGASWNGSGQVGSDALSFDGTDDYVNSDNIFDIKEHTISAWFYANGVSNQRRIVDDDDGSGGKTLYVNNGSLYWSVNDSGGAIKEITTSVNTGQWYHVVGVWDGSNIYLYVDGSQSNSASLSTHSVAVTEMIIGAQHTTGGDYFDGQIDDVRIYDRALSQPEINALASLTQPQGRLVEEADVPTQSDSGVSRYEFSSGSLTADSWGSNTLNDQTSATTATGVYGQAKSFDGSDDYMSGGPDLDSVIGDNNPTSFSLWVNPDDNTSVHSIFTHYDGTHQLNFNLEDNGTISFATYDGSFHGFEQDSSSGAGSYSANEWTHIVATFDGLEYRVYTNGSLAGAKSDSTFALPSSSIDLGRRKDKNSSHFDGNIDDVRIYSDALSPIEVEQLYNKGAYRIARGDVL